MQRTQIQPRTDAARAHPDEDRGDQPVAPAQPSVADSKLLEAGKVLTAVEGDPPGLFLQTLIRCRPEAMMTLLTNYRDMPEHIFGLQGAEVRSREGDTTAVRFTMKLPFPVGRLVWTNRVQTHLRGAVHSLSWTLIDGNLDANDGHLILQPYRGQPNLTHASYRVRVQPRTSLPRAVHEWAAQRLVPRIVAKLTRAVEQQT